MKQEEPEVKLKVPVKKTIKLRQNPKASHKKIEKPKRGRKGVQKQGDDDYWDPEWIGRPVIVDGVKISNYVASQDLNECVVDLLKKGQK